MSKARSPREVCSTTIGISGIRSAPLRAGGPEFRGFRRLLLLRRPDALARLVQVGCDRLRLGGDAVERLLAAQVVAERVCSALCDEALDVLVGFAGLAQVAAAVVVGDLDAELVRNRLEDELACDRR